MVYRLLKTEERCLGDLMSEVTEVSIDFGEEYAKEILWGGGQDFETSLLMRLDDYWYIREKVHQWKESATEPTHQVVVYGIEVPLMFRPSD